MKRPNYLQVKKGNYYFRRRVPGDLVDLLGRTEWCEALGTKDRETARLMAKPLEIRTDEEIRLGYRFQTARLSPDEASSAATKVSKRAEAYLRQSIQDIDWSEKAFRQRYGTLDRKAVTPTDLAGLLKQIADSPVAVDPAWERERARTQLADLMACLEAENYGLVEPYADEAFREVELARMVTDPDDAEIENLLVDRERSDYRALARTIMLREIEVLKQHLVNTAKAELGLTTAAPETPSFHSSAPLISLSDELAPDSAKTPSQLMERFKHDSRERRSRSTLASFATSIDYLEQVTGDKPIAAITRNDVVEWYTLVSRCPQKYQTRLRVRTIREAIIKNETAKIPINSLATTTKSVSHLRTFFEWARRLNLVAANPVGDLKVESWGKNSDRPPKTQTPAMLTTIFASDLYSDPTKRKSYRFWLPLLALYTGARMGEVCGLERSQVKTEGGHKWIEIHSSKTRKQYAVPIHPELQRIGFIAFVEKCKGGKLFPDAPVGAEGRNAYAPVSQWFARFLTGLGIKLPGRNMHAFRHTFITACRNSGIPEDMRKAFVGHSGGTVHDGYGDPVGLAARVEAMEKLRFDGLDLSHLHKG